MQRQMPSFLPLAKVLPEICCFLQIKSRQQYGRAPIRPRVKMQRQMPSFLAEANLLLPSNQIKGPPTGWKSAHQASDRTFGDHSIGSRVSQRCRRWRFLVLRLRSTRGGRSEQTRSGPCGCRPWLLSFLGSQCRSRLGVTIQ